MRVCVCVCVCARARVCVKLIGVGLSTMLEPECVCQYANVFLSVDYFISAEILLKNHTNPIQIPLKKIWDTLHVKSNIVHIAV
jgi:hypothetical protein